MITNNMYFYPRLCIFMPIPSFIVRTFRTFIPKLVILYGNLFGCNVAFCKNGFYSFIQIICVFLVSFREHFAHLIHSWICANIKVFMAILFQNFQVWMNVVLGNFWSASPEGVTGGGHRRRSSEGVTGGSHRRGSLKASIESYLLHVEFNHICLQKRFHSPQFSHENKNKLD